MSIDRIPAERMENGLYGKNIILDEPVYIEYNGGSISIVEVTVFYYDTINIQLFDEDEVGMKFCLVHRSFCSNERISQWDSEEYRLVIFPMLDKNADEIVHGQIVPYSLSFLNGYFIIDSERRSSLFLCLQFPMTLPSPASEVYVQPFF
mgnify:CR=1 FL=1